MVYVVISIHLRLSFNQFDYYHDNVINIIEINTRTRHVMGIMRMVKKGEVMDYKG